MEVAIVGRRCDDKKICRGGKKADARRKRQKEQAPTRKAVQTADEDDSHRMRKNGLLDTVSLDKSFRKFGCCHECFQC